MVCSHSSSLHKDVDSIIVVVLFFQCLGYSPLRARRHSLSGIGPLSKKFA